MGFTGLYFEYYYYSWFIFVFRFRKGAYDYYDTRKKEDMCGSRSKTDIEKICWTPSEAKAHVESLRIKK